MKKRDDSRIWIALLALFHQRATMVNMLVFALIGLGIPLAVFGVRLILRGDRPADLGGMVMAPVGMLLIGLGLAAMVQPRLLSSTETGSVGFPARGR
jgi:uncharacterized membrane protein YczE